jgi:transposase-like protein
MGTQRYSPEFKQAVVEELLAGAKRAGQICREQGIDFSTLRKWREQ